MQDESYSIMSFYSTKMLSSLMNQLSYARSEEELLPTHYYQSYEMSKYNGKSLYASELQRHGESVHPLFAEYLKYSPVSPFHQGLGISFWRFALEKWLCPLFGFFFWSGIISWPQYDSHSTMQSLARNVAMPSSLLDSVLHASLPIKLESSVKSLSSSFPFVYLERTRHRL